VTIEDHLLNELGYALNVEQSSIPNAGDGLKLRGKVLAGTAVVYLFSLFSHSYIPLKMQLW